VEQQEMAMAMAMAIRELERAVQLQEHPNRGRGSGMRSHLAVQGQLQEKMEMAMTMKTWRTSLQDSHGKCTQGGKSLCRHHLLRREIMGEDTRKGNINGEGTRKGNISGKGTGKGNIKGEGAGRSMIGTKRRRGARASEHSPRAISALMVARRRVLLENGDRRGMANTCMTAGQSRTVLTREG